MGRQIALCDLNLKTEDGLLKHEIYKIAKTLLNVSSETGWSLVIKIIIVILVIPVLNTFIFKWL